MKGNSFVLILVISMHTVNMFIMLHDLDTAYQVRTEQHHSYYKTPDDVDNGEHAHVDDDDHQHLGGDEKEGRPPPYLTGWEW